jgi:triosephosphate isomerase
MKYVIANLKMNFVTARECDQYLDALNQEWQKHKHSDAVKLIVCPSPLYTERFASKLPDGVLLGGQNAFWEPRGSFTGEISVLALQDAGVSAVVCGHSERRGYLSETNEQVGRKANAVIKNKMTAIVCIGETVEERDNEEMILVITEQITQAMENIAAEQLGNVVIAYEPRWAIGTDVTPSTQDIMQVRIMIQKILIKKYGAEQASKVAILYGGSVKASLMDEVCISADMAGVLVGRESLDSKELLKIVDKLL